jgi:GNAT superfamily N-acetyltransferase
VTIRITPLTDPDRLAWLATDRDGTPSGYAFLRTAGGELDLHVHPAERRRGVGSALLGAAVSAARERGLRRVTPEHVEQGSPGEKFLAARGLCRVLALTYARLGLADADVPAPEPPPGYRLVSWAGTVPGELAPTFAASRRAMDDMPMDDADVEPGTWTVDRVVAVAEAVAKRGDHLLTVAALAPDATIAGFSEVVVPGDGTGDGQHYGTGVLPGHRGRGLARQMKAEAIRLVRARFPDLGGLITDTADSNTVMRRINDRLGYAPTHRSLMYQLDLR